MGNTDQKKRSTTSIKQNDKRTDTTLLKKKKKKGNLVLQFTILIKYYYLVFLYINAYTRLILRTHTQIGLHIDKYKTMYMYGSTCTPY